MRKEQHMKNFIEDTNSADYLYMVCREYPLLVISTESGVGKYHFSSIGFRRNKMLIEFNLMMDNHYRDTQYIQEKIGGKKLMKNM